MIVTDASALADPDNVLLVSDTVSQPTEAMRAAMAAATVADEQYHADPTVTALERRCAQLLGQPAALLLPTGTMCNVIASLLHVERGGDEVLAHRLSHLFNAEAGGLARLAGGMVGALDSPPDVPEGTFTVDQLATAVRPASRYGPRTRMVSFEQTVNQAGGRVWPLDQLRAVATAARDRGLRVHMDGARLWNAAVAAGVEPAEYGRLCDTVWADFSKGLGCPGGAVLAGGEELMAQAWRYKQMLGGASRQGAGVLAAAALYALDHHVDRLAEDHVRAARLVDALTELPGIELVARAQETNIVLLDLPDAYDVAMKVAEDGVILDVRGASRVRCVTHLDVDDAGIERAITAIKAAS